MALLKSLRSKCLGIVARLLWLPPLLGRIVVGAVFAQSGWGKLQHLDKVVEFFTSLHIPHPELQAPFVASVELIGGSLLILGLLTRLAAIPLICTMIVALLTAKASDIGVFTDLFGLSEFLYIVILIDLVIRGAGAISLDRWLSAKLFASRAASSPRPSGSRGTGGGSRPRARR